MGILVFFRVGIALISFILNCVNPVNYLPHGRSPFEVRKLSESDIFTGATRKLEGNAPKKTQIPCPEETASHLSYLSYFWFFEYGKNLEKEI